MFLMLTKVDGNKNPTQLVWVLVVSAFSVALCCMFSQWIMRASKDCKLELNKEYNR